MEESMEDHFSDPGDHVFGGQTNHSNVFGSSLDGLRLSTFKAASNIADETGSGSLAKSRIRPTSLHLAELRR